MNFGGGGQPVKEAPEWILSGFTLAEVLITLGIIGIIAAMTIPNLVKKWEERAIISKYKKMYSTLANAYYMAVADNGNPEHWALSDRASLLKIFEPYLNVTERCYDKRGCVSDGDFNSLNGTKRFGRISQIIDYPKLRLNGGFSIVVFDPPHNGCEYDTTITDSSGNSVPLHVQNDCGSISGVINNTKGKDYINYLGKDHFTFVVSKKGIYPYGYKYSDEEVKNSCTKEKIAANTNGATCGTWILRYDNMDYFYGE